MPKKIELSKGSQELLNTGNYYRPKCANRGIICIACTRESCPDRVYVVKPKVEV